MTIFDPAYYGELHLLAMTIAIVIGGTMLLTFILIFLSKWITEGPPESLFTQEYDPPDGGRSRRPRKRKARVAPPRLRPTSEEEVFRVLVVALAAFTRKSSSQWTPKTTIADAFGTWWLAQAALRGEGNEGLRTILGRMFTTWLGELSFSKATSPENVKTLGDLATFVASSAQVPIVDPPSPETAFDVVRRILFRAGVNISNISPSTKLRRYLHRKVFRLQIVPLGLGKVPLPTPQLRNIMQYTSAAYFFAFMAAISCMPFVERALHSIFPVEVAEAIGVLIVLGLFFGWPLIGLANLFGLFPTKLGELVTFADLSRVIAEAHAESLSSIESRNALAGPRHLT